MVASRESVVAKDFFLCSRGGEVLGIIGSIVFGLASLVGLIFGSVSLATVVRAGSTLPSNVTRCINDVPRPVEMQPRRRAEQSGGESGFGGDGVRIDQ